jgi:transcriptional regulator with XRE-family HTH domain
MQTMFEARTRLGITQTQLSELTAINQAIISQIENGVRRPTPNQRVLISRALGPVTFNPKEDLAMNQNQRNVPAMPVLKYKDGKPDFSALESNYEQGTKEQLVDLINSEFAIDRSGGETIEIVQLSGSHAIVQLNLRGGTKLFKVNYSVEDDQVTLDEKPKQVEVSYSYHPVKNSKRRAVPPMPVAHYKDGKPVFDSDSDSD